MGRAQGARYDGGVRRYFSARCIGLHATLLVLLPLFAWLTWWQLNRAEGGNTLSWAYVVLWPAFAVYAVYTWWNLVQDQVAKATAPTDRVAVRRAASADAPAPAPTVGAPDAGDAVARPPGWALTGGRKKNVAIAAAAPIDAVQGGRGERYTAQTPDEAERLTEYNRYLAELAAEDAVEEAAQDALKDTAEAPS